MRLTLFPGPPVLAASSDAAALVAFAVVGMLSHHGGLSATGFARDALPLLAGWFAAAAVFDLYRRLTRRALLLTWIVGVTAGVAARAIALGRATEPRELAFLATTLVFSLALLCTFRAAVDLGRRPRQDSNLRPS